MEQARNRVQALAGRMIDGYQLARIVVNGTAEVVYRGKRAEKKPQPITRPGLPPLLLPELALVSLVPLDQQRPERAARLQQRMPALQRFAHPALLPLLRCGDDPVSGCVYAIYPYPAGGSLADRLSAAKGKPLPYTEINAYLTRLANALDIAHQQGYFHLHLTPHTILLDAAGEVYLADIGLAQLLDIPSAIAAGSLYAAPEQITHDEAGPATDIYGLGMVLYQLVTGRTAYESTRHQLQSPPPPSEYRPDLPAQVESVILRAIASYPTQRYATAGQLARDFTQAVQQAQTMPSARGIQGISAEAAPAVTPAVPSVAPPAPAPPRGKSFVVSTPASSGNTLYPPPQKPPEWKLPADLAAPQAPTRELPPNPAQAVAPVVAPKAPVAPAPRQKTASQRARRKRRSWAITIVSALIVLVSAAIVLVLIFPQLNRAIPLPFLTPGAGSQPSGSLSGAPAPRLYAAVTPGVCDKGGATWAQNTASVETCSASALLLNAPSCQNCPLAVVTLGTLPGGAAYPADFVVQVTVQPLATDATVPFGLKFRQQSLQDDGDGRGGYSFLVSQNGQWEFDKYAANGSKQTLGQGKLHGTLPPNATLGLIVDGSTYYFYVNDKLIATEHDTTYSSGYLCLVAAPSATILFSKFTLSRVA